MTAITTELQLSPEQKMQLHDSFPKAVREALEQAPAPLDAVEVFQALHRGVSVEAIVMFIRNPANLRTVPWGDTGELCPSTALGMKPVRY